MILDEKVKIRINSRNFGYYKDKIENLKNNVSSVVWNASYKAFNEATTSEALQLYTDGAFTSGGINRWVPYGTPLATRTFGTCAAGSYYIEPRPDDPVLTSTNSDQRYSNHFYQIDLNSVALSGVDEISVNFTKVTASGTNTEFDILLLTDDYLFNIDYSCSVYDSHNNCTTYIPSRTTNQYVVKSDRRAGAISTKTIKGLSSLDRTQKYILNIRAYTPNKSISITTDYLYTITDQSGATLCP